jgi:hypothetical protein
MAFMKRKSKTDKGVAGAEVEVEMEWHDHWWVKAASVGAGALVGREAQKRGWLGGGAGADLEYEVDFDCDM